MIYLIAFASATHQVDGLIGSRGILPVGSYLQAIDQQYGWHGRVLLPSLLWIDSSDRALHVLCGSGIALSLLLVAGVFADSDGTIGLWTFISVADDGGAGRSSGFQWDALLLETGLLAVFYSPLQLMLWRKPRLAPSGMALLLLRLLLFQADVQFRGCEIQQRRRPTWRHFAAFALSLSGRNRCPPVDGVVFQPIAAMVSGVISVGFTFFAELIAPEFIFGPRVLRLIAFWTLIVFAAADHRSRAILVSLICWHDRALCLSAAGRFGIGRRDGERSIRLPCRSNRGGRGHDVCWQGSPF